MNDDMHSDAVQRALDVMERTHRSITLGGWLIVVMTVAAYWRLDHIAQTSTDIKRVIMAAVFALTCVIAWTAFALGVLMVRMIRRVLRAIDLAMMSGRPVA